VAAVCLRESGREIFPLVGRATGVFFALVWVALAVLTVDSLLVLDAKLFEEDPKAFIADKRKQMGEAVEQLDFETAALIRDELYRLEGKEVPVPKAKKPAPKKRWGR